MFYYDDVISCDDTKLVSKNEEQLYQAFRSCSNSKSLKPKVNLTSVKASRVKFKGNFVFTVPETEKEHIIFICNEFENLNKLISG